MHSPGPNIEGNRPADEMRTEDQGMCRRVRLTVRLGLDPSHFAGQQGREGIQENGTSGRRSESRLDFARSTTTAKGRLSMGC